MKASSAKTQRHLRKVNKQLGEAGTLSVYAKKQEMQLENTLRRRGQRGASSFQQGSVSKGHDRSKSKERTLCYDLSVGGVEPAWEKKGRPQADSK